MIYKQLRGVVVATVTPFNDSGQVDSGILKEMYEFLITSDVQGLFPCGSTGEGILLTTEEREKVAEVTIQQADGRIPVIIHTGSINMNEAIRLTVHAREIGAAGAALIPPYYYNMDNSCILDYYRTIAKAAKDLPLYLYNIPMNVKNSISPAVLVKLMQEFPNIVGVKDTSMDFMSFINYKQAAPEHLCTLMGNDAQIYSCLLMGGNGAISATATAFPAQVAAIYHHYLKGDIEKALEAQQVVIKLREVLRNFTPIAPIKQILEWKGIKVGAPRRPLRPLTIEEQESLRNKLADIGFTF